MSPIDREAWRARPFSMAGATVFGTGHLPGGPGTYAAIASLPAVWLASGVGAPWRFALFALLTLAGIAWCERAGRALGEPDSRKIVIDEVAGVWAALLPFAHLTLAELVIGCALFRLFDIWKPGPIRTLDLKLHGGLGVMVDDLAAGALAVPLVWAWRVSGLDPSAGWGAL